MENITFQDSSFQAPRKPAPFNTPSSRAFIVVIIIVLLLGVGVFGANRFGFLGDTFQKTVALKPSTPTPKTELVSTDAPTPTPSTSPSQAISPAKTSSSPTPTKTEQAGSSSSGTVDQKTGLDRAKLSVVVKNGSGEAGVAKKGSDLLQGLGYTISSTGNADHFTYQGVTISVKSAYSKYLPLLKTDLSTSYTVSQTLSTLPTTSTADAEVIIGK